MINSHLVHDCRKKITYQEVEDDVRKFGITNILDDEDEDSLYDICEALYQDYTIRNTNYKAYIEKGMNARILMELRKSALLPFTYQENADKFFKPFDNCKTVEDVKKVRRYLIKQLNPDYEDLGWQYYYLSRMILGTDKLEDYYFDLEQCFADRDLAMQESIDDYEKMFVRAHIPPSMW